MTNDKFKQKLISALEEALAAVKADLIDKANQSINFVPTYYSVEDSLVPKRSLTPLGGSLQFEFRNEQQEDIKVTITTTSH